MSQEHHILHAMFFELSLSVPLCFLSLIPSKSCSFTHDSPLTVAYCCFFTLYRSVLLSTLGYITMFYFWCTAVTQMQTILGTSSGLNWSRCQCRRTCRRCKTLFARSHPMYFSKALLLQTQSLAIPPAPPVLGKLRSLQAIWLKLICRSRKVFMCGA